MRRLFNICMRVLCAPNETVLLVYIPANIKMSFIWQDDFFLLKSFGSQIFPSVVQAYTQPYSLGGRINLIICQIRHELSVVTIHKISTSWKNKTLDGGPYITLLWNYMADINFFVIHTFNFFFFFSFDTTTTTYKIILNIFRILYLF